MKPRPKDRPWNVLTENGIVYRVFDTRSRDIGVLRSMIFAESTHFAMF